jgi:hypothetical protein
MDTKISPSVLKLQMGYLKYLLAIPKIQDRGSGRYGTEVLFSEE